MREIEFRGLKYATREWVYGDYSSAEGGIIKNIRSGIYANIIEGTIGQYTGLKDKKGIKIFEGDVFKTAYGVTAAVEWDKENARFLGLTTDKKIIYIGREPTVEIIGNIHDN